MLCVISAFAQTPENPNRMLVVKPSGAFKAFNIDQVQEIKFANVEGRVACDVEYVSCTLSTVNFELYKDAGCESYLINVLPAVIVKQLEANPASAGDYLAMYNSPQDNREGVDFQLQGLELEKDTEYAIVTVGIDKYDCYGDVCAAYFTTPGTPLVGNPNVTCTITAQSLTSITISFSANADVKGFAAVAGPKGELQSQYEKFAPMMGFTNIGQMVKGWGINFNGNGTYSHTWEDLDPNTEYEIYVQAWDKNDTFAPLQIVNAKTESKGGEGVATVEISAGDYVLAQWDDKMLPSQFFNFTPNDQTWRYRFGVYETAEYEANRAEIIDYIQSEPEMAMAYWWWYEPFSTDFQINPNTEVVVVASAQNAKGEWGPVNEFKYTTPASGEDFTPAKVSRGIAKVATRFSPIQRENNGMVRTRTVRLSK